MATTRIPSDVKNRVRNMGAEGLSVRMIAARVGLGPRSVRRLLAKRKTMDGRLIPHKVRRDPLYDPGRDGCPELDITATIMGDPPPGRRELLARAGRGSDKSDKRGPAGTTETTETTKGVNGTGTKC
jgi:hypothetical protein